MTNVQELKERLIDYILSKGSDLIKNNIATEESHNPDFTAEPWIIDIKIENDPIKWISIRISIDEV